jgi:mono/diheme cytochrome c family protein
LRLVLVAVVALALAGPAFGADVVDGKTVFKHYCGTCHTLKDAGTVGHGASRGPVLTGKSVTVAKLRAVMSGMSAGMMPAFVGKLSTKQMNDVVAYVVKASKPA